MFILWLDSESIAMIEKGTMLTMRVLERGYVARCQDTAKGQM